MGILQKFSLENRIAVITGSGRGLGFEIASAFAEAGAHVWLTGRNAKTLQQAVDTLRKAGGKADYAAFGGFFTGIGRKGSTGGGTKIFDKAGQDQKHPRTGETVPTAGLGAPPLAADALGHRRQALADWMTAPNNPPP